MKKAIYLILFSFVLSSNAKAQVTGNTNTLHFDGVNDYVFCANNAPIQITTGTIEAWIKVPVTGAGSGYHGIAVKQISYGLFLNSDVLVVYDWSPTYCSGSGGETSTGQNMADGGWHHVAMSFQSGVSNGTIIYIDGVLKTTLTYNVCVPVGHNLTIGTGNTNGTEQFFKGLIDEVRVWNVVRTQAEIQANMFSEFSSVPASLVAYFKFNHGISGGNNTAITSLTDASANAAHGVLKNIALTGNTSNFVASDIVLPVELLHFAATPLSHAVKLSWETANEVNNKGFQIERLNVSSKNWDPIGFVFAHNKASTYEYIDDALISEKEVGYYRLRQNDNDGYETLSKIVSVNFEEAKGLKVYPSIVTDGILKLETQNTDNSDFHIFNLLGQLVQKGKTVQLIDVLDLPQGTYIIKVGTAQAKFMKK